MSVISSAIKSQRFTPTPPAKGSFPFDRYGICSETVTKYLSCLKENKGSIEKCRQISKEYLECRMENNLMAKDEWKNLGFSNENEVELEK